MRPRRPLSDLLAQGLALGTVVVAVLLVLWNLRAMPWSSPLGLADAHSERERGLLLAMLAISGALTAGIAAIRPQRREFLWFGALNGLLALHTQAVPGATEGVGGLNAADISTVRLVLVPLCTSVGLLFASHLVRRPARRVVLPLLFVSLALAALGLLLPAGWARPLMLADTGLVLVAMAVAAWLYVGGLRDRVPGLGAVGLATAPLSAVALLDLFVGGAEAGALRVGGLLLFSLVVTMALVLQLGQASEWYENLVKQARDVILVLDAKGYVTAANPAASTLLERAVVGLPFHELVCAGDRPLARAHLDSPARGRGAELRLLTAQGAEVYVESVATPLPEQHTLLVVRDVTSRHQIESSIIESARLETAAILASGMAHDFNNAMAALLGHVEMLRNRADEAMTRRLDRMEAVIRRAAAMTRRIMSAVRGGGGERVSLALHEPVQSAVELARSMMPPEVTLDVDLAPDLSRVLANASDLEHALLNLLLNARDAMPEGGTIRVSATRVLSGPCAGGACLSVEDQGPGVPPELRARIWEPFFTTKGAGRGTGLGLAMVARVARDHGGAIDITDARGGRGARFSLTLPPAEQTATLSTGSRRLKARALVVDDDIDVREHMRAELAARGCEVVAAADAEEAERHFDEAGGSFDLLVTDAILPGASGVTLAHRLTARRPGLAVLVVSGFIPENEHALSPTWGRLDKPFTSDRFAVAVRRTMLRTLRAAGEETA